MKTAWLTLLLLFASQGLAHKPSDSYLQLSRTSDGYEGEWRIALRDLDAAIGLDDDRDRRITWGELRTRHAAISDYALSRLDISANESACGIHPGPQLVDELSDGKYTVLPIRVACANTAGPLTLEYRLFFDIDPTHRGLLTLLDDDDPQTFVLSPERAQVALSEVRADRWQQFTSMLREGVWHIWIGYDHILFLLALLLGAGVQSTPDSRTASRWRTLTKDVLTLVTAFTIAHSVTLSLAALRLVSLPPRFVETSIAASIVVAGLLLMRPQPRGAPWIAGAFGLIHGFGFANVLADMQLPTGSLALSLFSFNLGVELGQCAIVLVALPLVGYLSGQRFYRPALLPAAAVLIALVGALWSMERAVQVDLLELMTSVAP